MKKTKSRLAAALVMVATTASNDGHVAAQNNPRPAHGKDVTTCSQVPTLHCKNGSTCQEGIAAFGKLHEHLGLQTHESGYYCKCPPGFIGHECGVQVDDCQGGEKGGYDPSDPTGVLRSCYHGSQCRSSEGAAGGFYCDCERLNALGLPTATKYAGMMCQHESTSLCAASLTADRHSPREQFCTNHGKCVKMVTGEEPHPGCICRDGWMGDRCEVRDDVLLANAHKNKDSDGEGVHGEEVRGKAISGIVLFSLLIGSMGLVMIYLVVLLIRAKRDGGGGEGDKKVVGADDLEADGSGTLGQSSKDTTEDIPPGNDSNYGIGDLEMTESDKKTVKPEFV